MICASIIILKPSNHLALLDYVGRDNVIKIGFPFSVVVFYEARFLRIRLVDQCLLPVYEKFIYLYIFFLNYVSDNIDTILPPKIAGE